MDSTLVEVKNGRFKRGDRVIFDGVDLSVARGKITAIMGPSGTGKTTLLHLISQSLTLNSGDIFLNGESIIGLSRKQLFKVRQQMGMLFQYGALFTDLNVYENVAFPLREHTNLSERLIRMLVLMKLESVGLRGAHTLDIHELSGGMARRVALARAIMLDPELMLYDEPFTGQDPISRGILLKLIRELNDALGLTSIVVSHDIKETLRIADFVCILAAGKVIAFGTPEEISANNTPEVRQFINGLPDGPVAFHYPGKSLEEDLLS